MDSPGACSATSSVTTGSGDRTSSPPSTPGVAGPVAVALRLSETRRALARSSSVHDPAPPRRPHRAAHAALDAPRWLRAEAGRRRPAPAAENLPQSASEWLPAPAWDVALLPGPKSPSVSSVDSETSLGGSKRVGNVETVVADENAVSKNMGTADGKNAAPWFESPDKFPDKAKDSAKDILEEPRLLSRLGGSVQRGLKGASFHTGFAGRSEPKATERKTADRNGWLRSALMGKEYAGARHSFRRPSVGDRNVNRGSRRSLKNNGVPGDQKGDGPGAGWIDGKWEAKERQQVGKNRFHFLRGKRSAREEMSERYI